MFDTRSPRSTPRTPHAAPPTARSISSEFLVSQQRACRPCSNDWVWAGEDALKFHEVRLKELEEAAAAKALEAQREALAEAAEPAVDAAVEDILEKLVRSKNLLEQAVNEMQAAKMSSFNQAAREKREKVKAAKAEEAAKANARDELANKRAKERKAKEDKEKAELAKLRAEAGF
jgi:colicin import membrane protein